MVDRTPIRQKNGPVRNSRPARFLNICEQSTSSFRTKGWCPEDGMRLPTTRRDHDRGLSMRRRHDRLCHHDRHGL
jgi:hypothetical protein